jgi:ribosomal protein S18 acetylase RimI-like enzyme
MSRDAGTTRQQPPTVRSYRDGDIRSVRACVVELQDDMRRIDDRLGSGESMADAYRDYLFEQCITSVGTILVVESDCEVVGFACVLARVPHEGLDEPSGHYAFITDLIVREPFRRRGLGEALLEAAERWARTAGATDLRLGVLSENASAMRLYLRAGFKPYSEILAKPLG